MKTDKALPAAAVSRPPCEPRAVVMRECPTPGRCKCGKCEWCGYQKHTAVHGGLYGIPDDGISIPYGHEFGTGRKSSQSARTAAVKRSMATIAVAEIHERMSLQGALDSGAPQAEKGTL